MGVAVVGVEDDCAPRSADVDGRDELFERRKEAKAPRRFWGCCCCCCWDGENGCPFGAGVLDAVGVVGMGVDTASAWACAISFFCAWERRA